MNRAKEAHLKETSAEHRPSAWSAILEVLLVIAVAIAAVGVARGWFTNSLPVERTRHRGAQSSPCSGASPTWLAVEAGRAMEIESRG
jgi:hypothetical protein